MRWTKGSSAAFASGLASMAVTRSATRRANAPGREPCRTSLSPLPASTTLRRPLKTPGKKGRQTSGLGRSPTRFSRPCSASSRTSRSRSLPTTLSRACTSCATTAPPTEWRSTRSTCPHCASSTAHSCAAAAAAAADVLSSSSSAAAATAAPPPFASPSTSSRDGRALSKSSSEASPPPAAAAASDPAVSSCWAASHGAHCQHRSRALSAPRAAFSSSHHSTRLLESLALCAVDERMRKCIHEWPSQSQSISGDALLPLYAPGLPTTG